jgi:ribose 5-phosphate isomerase A
MNPKKAAAEKAVENIREGMIIGLGTGSTAFWAIQKIGELVRAGLDIKAVATSIQSENLARELGIPILAFSDVVSVDLTIDGADEVDRQGNLIKGGGGALLREKIIAYNSKAFHVIVDHKKMVEQLGKFPLPVEIIPFAHELTLKRLRELAATVVLRKTEDKIFITDNGNMIADGNFYPVSDPASLDARLKSIPGVAETGLFLRHMVTTITVSDDHGNINTIRIAP